MLNTTTTDNTATFVSQATDYFLMFNGLILYGASSVWHRTKTQLITMNLQTHSNSVLLPTAWYKYLAPPVLQCSSTPVLQPKQCYLIYNSVMMGQLQLLLIIYDCATNFSHWFMKVSVTIQSVGFNVTPGACSIKINQLNQ